MLVPDLEAIKKYEAESTSRRAKKGQPLVVRLDGRAFHTFTNGLVKRGQIKDDSPSLPFHQGLCDLMIETTKYLVKELHANIAYTQSDEISLVFLSDADSTSQIIFDGRFQKIESISAAMATAYFNKNLARFVPEKKDAMPLFDSRAFTVPDIQVAYHVLLWRQKDATRNAISVAAHSVFSTKQLHQKSGLEMRKMLLSCRHKINFEDYPDHFKRGIFVRRDQLLLPPSEFLDVPEKYRPKDDVVRTKIVAFDLELTSVEDPIAALFPDKNKNS